MKLFTILIFTLLTAVFFSSCDKDSFRLSDEKSITAFKISSVRNPSLAADIVGKIQGDSIFLDGPAGLSAGSLIPTIEFTGVSISPQADAPNNFSVVQTYTVTASDSSKKKYFVKLTLAIDTPGPQVKNFVVFAGSLDGNIYALDATTGTLKWKYQTAGAVYSTPTLSNDVIYVGSSDGSLYAINAASGSLKWKRPLNDSVLTAPTVVNGIAYVTTRRAFAVDAESGVVKWASNPYAASLSSPTVAQGRMYFGEALHGVYCLNTANGEQIWHTDCGVVRSNPAVADERVFVGSRTSQLVVMNAKTGQLISEYFRDGIGSPGNPTILGENAIIGTDIKDPLLLSINYPTQKMNWGIAFHGGVVEDGGVFFSPVVSEGLVVSASSDAFIYAVGVNLGYKWRYGSVRVKQNPVDYKSIASVTAANGVIFSGSFDKSIVALDLYTGKLLWKYTTGGDVFSGPCVMDVNGRVFHSGISGDLQ